MADRWLEISLGFNFTINYRRIDEGVLGTANSQINVNDRVPIVIADKLTSSPQFGTDKANLFAAKTLTLTPGVIESLEITPLTDVFNEKHSILALKGIIIYVKSDDPSHYVLFNYKTDYHTIGPRGITILWEDSIKGLEFSESEEESESESVDLDLRFKLDSTSGSPCEIEVIVFGSEAESSSEESSSEG